MATECRTDVTSCHNGNLGNGFLLHFPAGTPASLAFMAQLGLICDFVSPALVVSLKRNKVSSDTTKHQRLPPPNRNSGSGVHSPTRLAAATPAPSCVWWCFGVHSDLLAEEELCAPPWAFYALTKAGDSEGPSTNPHTCRKPLLRLVHSSDIHPIQPVLGY